LNRIKIHGKIAKILERIHGDDEDQSELIAYHYRNSDDEEGAIRFSLKASRCLLKNYRLKDCMSFVESAYNLILSSDNKGSYRNLRFEIYNTKSLVYQITGNYELALNYISLIKELDPQPDKEKLLLTEINHAEIHIEKGDFLSGERIIKSVINKLKKDKVSKGVYIKALKSLAYLETFKQNLKRSRELCEEGIFLADDHSSEKGSFFTYYGFNFYYGNRYFDALAYFNKALGIFEKTADRALTGKILCNIGMVHFKTGDYKKALEWYGRSFKILNEIEYSRALAITRMNMAVTYDHLGDYKKAIKEYNAVLKISESTGNSRVLMMVFCNIGEVFTRLGKYRTALRYLKDSISLSEYVGSVFWKISGLLYLGICLSEMNERREAEEILEQAFETAAEQNEKVKLLQIRTELLKLKPADKRSMTELQGMLSHLEGDPKIGISENLKLRVLEIIAEKQIAGGSFSEAIATVRNGQDLSVKHQNIEYDFVFEVQLLECLRGLGKIKSLKNRIKSSEEKFKGILLNIPRDVVKFYSKKRLISVFLELYERYGGNDREKLSEVLK
jgi:tetratricopeptide (TPR) repeat protein